MDSRAPRANRGAGRPAPLTTPFRRRPSHRLALFPALGAGRWRATHRFLYGPRVQHPGNRHSFRKLHRIVRRVAKKCVDSRSHPDMARLGRWGQRLHGLSRQPASETIVSDCLIYANLTLSNGGNVVVFPEALLKLLSGSLCLVGSPNPMSNRSSLLTSVPRSTMPRFCSPMVVICPTGCWDTPWSRTATTWLPLVV